MGDQLRPRPGQPDGLPTASSSDTTHATGPERLKRGLAGLPFAEQQRRLGVAPGGDALDPETRGLADPAQPLPGRAALERAFGQDFGDVVIHSGPEAEQANAELGSRAFTLGTHISVAEKNLPPQVLAHELSHVVQQTGRGKGGAAAPASLEDEADSAAAAVAADEPVEVSGSAPAQVQKWSGSEHRSIGDRAFRSAYRRNAAALGDLVTDAARPVSVADGDVDLSFGDASRFAGDHAKSYADFEAHAESGKHDHYNHTFVTARKEWATHHMAALDQARGAASRKRSEAERKEAFAEALRLEGFASHFLEDAFAAGHLVPRSLEWLAGLRDGTGNKAKREKLQGTSYHDWFNAHGVRVQNDAGKAYTAYGDKELNTGGAKPSKALVQKAIERSLDQVMRVASGQLKLGQTAAERAEKKAELVDKVLELTPEIDVERYERKGAKENWRQAAAVEMMAADFQNEYDLLQDSTKPPKTTHSGGLTTMSGPELTADETVKDLFDGEFAGKTGLAAAKARIRRDLLYLARSLEARDVAFSKELLHALRVRTRQSVPLAPAGALPAWFTTLQDKLAGDWKGYAKSFQKSRATWLAEVNELRAAAKA